MQCCPEPLYYTCHFVSFVAELFFFSYIARNSFNVVNTSLYSDQLFPDSWLFFSNPTQRPNDLYFFIRRMSPFQLHNYRHQYCTAVLSRQMLQEVAKDHSENHSALSGLENVTKKRFTRGPSDQRTERSRGISPSRYLAPICTARDSEV